MKKVILIFVASGYFLTATNAQSSGTLQLKQGSKYQVENKLETSSTTEVQGQPMDSKANITTNYLIQVKDHSGDQYHLTNTVTHMIMNMTMMGQEVNFDSNVKEDMDGEMGSAVKDYINVPKDVVMDHTGKIISTGDADSSGSAIYQQLNLAATGYGAQMAFLALPKNPKVGDKWTENSNDSGIKRNTNYTIKSIEGNIATIAFDGTVDTDTKMENQGMEMSTKTSGKFSGEEKVDIKTGVIQSNTSTGEASGTVSAMGQNFPTSTKITSTTTVKNL